ncbi:MAG TPA: GNAT family N-acetyltransferase [Solirubrobacterales bacterium]|jgi:GNAT superfamily N-acetyltransferase|nr:GNAT family N-acetyltransferase [Solirubrobacterales bacterium]
MGQRLDEQELRRRAIESVRDQVEAFGSAHGDSKVIRRQGLLAAIVPSSPRRSFFNSVFYSDRDALCEEIEALGEVYDSSGVRAWTVWVPDEDRDAARMLAGRGHRLDASPRAMAMALADLGPELRAPESAEPAPVDVSTGAMLNDRAYGFGTEGFAAGIAGETSIQWHGAFVAGEPVGCVGTIEIGDDCLITGVATPPEHRGRGIASWLVRNALTEAREQGMATASLQASRAGASIYERLGFRDLGFVEMWELRR